MIDVGQHVFAVLHMVMLDVQDLFIFTLIFVIELVIYASGSG